MDALRPFIFINMTDMFDHHSVKVFYNYGFS